MIEEIARVVALEGDIALLETRRTSACGGCQASSGCGTALIGRFLGNRSTQVRAYNRAGAGIGQQVVLGLDESGLLKAASALYLVPLLGLLLGAILGGRLAGLWLPAMAEPGAILSAVAGLLGGLAWARRFGARAGHDGRYQAVVMRTLDRVPVAVKLNEIGRSGSQ